MGMEDADAYVILMNCDDRWGKYKNRTPENRSKVFLDQIAKARQKIGIKAEKKLTEVRPFYSVRELLALDFSNVGWWFDQLYATQTLGFIGGDPGVGKSTFMLQMSMHATAGVGQFLKWENKKVEVTSTGFFSFEMDAFQVQYFVKHLIRGYDEPRQEIIMDNFRIDTFGSSENLNDKKARQTLLDFVDQYEIKFLTIDSLRAVTKLRDENIEDFLDFVDKDLRRDRDCSVWVIHHNRKPAQGEQRQEQSLADLYGSTSIGAAAATVIGLEKKASNRIQLNHLKTRMAPEFDSFFLQRNEHLHFEISTNQDKEKQKKSSVSGGVSIRDAASTTFGM
jgi:RecA-family ATPase